MLQKLKVQRHPSIARQSVRMPLRGLVVLMRKEVVEGGCPQLALNSEASQQVLTTIVVRNIPRHFQVPDLLREIQLVGFKKFVTLVNLPQDRRKASNRGYAFVNFQTPDAAFCFLKALNGHQWCESPDTAMADWAMVQGHEATAALAQGPLPRRRRGGSKWCQRPCAPEEGEGVGQ